MNILSFVMKTTVVKRFMGDMQLARWVCQGLLILGEIDSATHTRYVPSIAKIKTELSVSNVIDLQTSIARTADWYAEENRRTQ